MIVCVAVYVRKYVLVCLAFENQYPLSVCGWHGRWVAQDWMSATTQAAGCGAATLCIISSDLRTHPGWGTARVVAAQTVASHRMSVRMDTHIQEKGSCVCVIVELREYGVTRVVGGRCNMNGLFRREIGKGNFA